MNFTNIIGEIGKVDPEVYDRMDTRRSAMKRFANVGGRITLAAIPLALGSMFQKAYAGANSTNDTVVEILNYALTLEYLEADFYATALTKSGLIPSGAPRGAIQTIAAHEAAHVAFLKAAIMQMGTPVKQPKFDFSAGGGTGNGPFKDVFKSYDLFLAVAQTFEDTGVRAYKGRAAELVKGGDLLEAALNIHSVEARHASHIRQMRKANNFGDVKPWITGNMSGINSAAVQPSYNGEENTKQAGVEITALNPANKSKETASEAFDEGLTKAQVLKIVTPFIKP